MALFQNIRSIYGALICWFFAWSLCLINLTASETDTSGTKCYKNKDLGEYDANIYYCPDPNKPECCEENQEFTCCEKKAEHTLKNQLILWGAVFGVVGAVAIAWICYRKDTYICEGETLNQRINRCCGCEKKVNPDEKITLSDINSTDEKKTMDDDNDVINSGSHGQYYENDDDTLALTTRQVTTQINTTARDDDKQARFHSEGHSRNHGNDNGNQDSDSGRGSTMSIEVLGSQGSAVTTREIGQPFGEVDGDEEVKGKKGRKRGRKKSKKDREGTRRKSKMPLEILELEECS